MNFAQVNTKVTKLFNDGSAAFTTALGKAQKFLDKDLQALSIDEFETNWNWEDVDGYDFTGEKMD